MDGVGGSSGFLKDIDFDRSIALQRSCRRYLLIGCPVVSEASSKEYLVTGLRVEKDEQGARSIQAIAHA